MPQPVPEGYHTITPYLAVDSAAEAIDFYRRAFGAKERVRMDGPGDSIMHAELEIGDSLIMLSDPFPQASTVPPKQLGGTSVSIFVYVENIDELYKKAIDAGASSLLEPDDMFWATASGPSRTRSGTPGRSRRTSRTWRPRRCSAAPRSSWRRWRARPRGEPSEPAGRQVRRLKPFTKA